MKRASQSHPKPRQQASTIPFRYGDHGLEFCLITTRRSARWGFPKGRISNGQTAQAAALQEAHEEAGLRGYIVAPALGRYNYKKRGQRQSVIVMLMEVTGADEDWHESSERSRRWVDTAEALELLDRATLQRMLEMALHRLGVDADASCDASCDNSARPGAAPPLTRHDPGETSSNAAENA